MGILPCFSVGIYLQKLLMNEKCIYTDKYICKTNWVLQPLTCLSKKKYVWIQHPSFPCANGLVVPSPTFTTLVRFRTRLESLECVATLTNFETLCLWIQYIYRMSIVRSHSNQNINIHLMKLQWVLAEVH